jgi:3-hydroxy-3-methylglutaryl CoA synthase
MKLLREQLVISIEKIVNYLLVKKEKNDKSSFLKKLGYTQNNVAELIEDIITLATTNEIIKRK